MHVKLNNNKIPKDWLNNQIEPSENVVPCSLNMKVKKLGYGMDHFLIGGCIIILICDSFFC